MRRAGQALILSSHLTSKSTSITTRHAHSLLKVFLSATEQHQGVSEISPSGSDDADARHDCQRDTKPNGCVWKVQAQTLQARSRCEQHLHRKEMSCGTHATSWLANPHRPARRCRGTISPKMKPKQSQREKRPFEGLLAPFCT